LGNLKFPLSSWERARERGIHALKFILCIPYIPVKLHDFIERACKNLEAFILSSLNNCIRIIERP
jgi:hypothetical protein